MNAREQLDRTIVRLAADDPCKIGDWLQAHRIRVYVRRYLMQEQDGIQHVDSLVKRCVGKGYLVRRARGSYQLTDSGLEWIGGNGALLDAAPDNVANTP